RARPEREPDRVVEQRVVVLTAEAEIDYAGPAPGRLVDPLDRSALVEKAEGARIPHTQDGVGVDPDDPDAVVRRRDDGADRGPVVLVLVGGRLRVERRRV